VVVMDLRMPRMDGIAATREIKRAQPLVQVLGTKAPPAG
jgi:CheY-like chemotaxis protein